MLSTKKKTVITVTATKLHFIVNMFPASLNYFPLQALRTPLALRCDTEQKNAFYFRRRPTSPLHFCAQSKELDLRIQ